MSTSAYVEEYSHFEPIAIAELEWRSYAVLAKAGETISAVARQSRHAVFYYSVLRDTKSIANSMRDLLDMFHAPDSIQAFEAATPDQLSGLIEKGRNIHSKLEEVTYKIRRLRLGYWERLYRGPLIRLDDYNQELERHLTSFAASDQQTLLLTKRDQEQLLASICNPPEPTEALRRAFAKR